MTKRMGLGLKRTADKRTECQQKFGNKLTNQLYEAFLVRATLEKESTVYTMNT